MDQSPVWLSREETDRNKFERIENFDPKERKKYKVKRLPFDVAKKGVKVARCKVPRISVSTVRRKADKWSRAGHDNVVRRGAGSQREINMPLLWDLEEDK